VIATGHLNGTVRVAVVGEIDIAVHDRLRAALAAALCAGPAEVVVDLAATTFLDAGGISVLLHAQHDARRAGRHLRITNPQHTPRCARSSTSPEHSASSPNPVRHPTTKPRPSRQPPLSVSGSRSGRSRCSAAGVGKV
jgi:anti-anti-sigma factor